VEYWQKNIDRELEKAMNVPCPGNLRQPDFRIFFVPF
jgi:hypothetical protein